MSGAAPGTSVEAFNFAADNTTLTSIYLFGILNVIFLLPLPSPPSSPVGHSVVHHPGRIRAMCHSFPHGVACFALADHTGSLSCTTGPPRPLPCILLFLLGKASRVNFDTPIAPNLSHVSVPGSDTAPHFVQVGPLHSRQRLDWGRYRETHPKKHS